VRSAPASSASVGGRFQSRVHCSVMDSISSWLMVMVAPHHEQPGNNPGREEKN